ncbi:MAG: murein biosynthesis integral membrane protein MurJ [Opitutales bacterium]
MLKSLQSIGIVSLATILSRILGLVRDILTVMVFGASALGSAFFFAFTIPNLFRRLLGEGALTAAMIPTMSEELEERGRDGAFSLLNKVATWLLVLSVGILAVGILLFYQLERIPGLEERWYVGAELGRILFPYMLFVCLAALLAAALNVLGRFAIPALSPVWLNVAMIFFLLVLGGLFAVTPEGKMIFLCLGVLAGGVVQVMVPVIALHREGWRPAPDFRSSPRLRELSLLMLPGLAGTAIFQINVVVSRLLAFYLDESAVTILYLANRLMELPLGIFTIAVATVIFPLLSRCAARRDFHEFAAAYQKGIRLILIIMIPASAGIVLLREPIVTVLFQWGAFDGSDTRNTLPVVAVFALALPFYSLATYVTRGFYSLKDLRTPVRVAGVSFLANFLLSVTLMQVFGMVGLALANLLSVIVQALALQVAFARKVPGVAFFSQWPTVTRILISSAGMGVFVVMAKVSLFHLLPPGRAAGVLVLALIIPSAVAAYAFFLWLLNVEGRSELEALVKRSLRAKSVKME